MIRLAGVRKTYGTRVALEAFTLLVRPGETVALVGPNGAGKSTVLKSAVGIVRPSAGEVWINGFNALLEPEAARRLVGYVPQNLTVPDYVSSDDLLGLVAALRGVPRRVAVAALDRVGLADRRHWRVKELSGGQRQRLSLALALVGDPRALILDEPSISLDVDGADAACAVIAEARRAGAAVLFASHHLSEVAALADRVVVLREGRVAATAASAEIRDAAAFETFYRGALRRAVMHAA